MSADLGDLDLRGLDQREPADTGTEGNESERPGPEFVGSF